MIQKAENKLQEFNKKKTESIIATVFDTIFPNVDSIISNNDFSGFLFITQRMNNINKNSIIREINTEI